MSFQAEVGTWFAAHLLADMPVGGRFLLSPAARPIAIQFETGEALDDVRVELSTAGAIHVQCKTNVGLTKSATSPLAEVIGQLVKLIGTDNGRKEYRDPSFSAAVLATSTAAPASLGLLEKGCRAFDAGGDWQQVLRQLAGQEQGALDVFRLHASAAWTTQFGTDISDETLRDAARLFHIARFDSARGGADWREASRVVGSRLFGSESEGEHATTALLNLVRQLIRNGAPADRLGLVRGLRTAGIVDLRAPGFDSDISKLGDIAADEERRLHRHTLLPLGQGVPIERECLEPILAAAEEGSLLVVGEPGAGKTGVLTSILTRRRNQRLPTVFLSVDRVPGIATADDLRRELQLEHRLVDILKNWPGTEPGMLILDALDASRGGPSEAVFAQVIQEAIDQVSSRWCVIASIRTFDLRNGRRFRDLFKGEPPNAGYAEQGIDRVRHFKVPALSHSELQVVGKLCPPLETLYSAAGPPLQALLANVFNLSLAADLVQLGLDPQKFAAITSQSSLIDRYEDERLPETRLKVAASRAVGQMVVQRKLSVRKVAIDHEALDDVLKSGVLSEAGDLVSFSHHILFDHVAGRFFLTWDDDATLASQVSSEGGTGHLLAPALRFALERIFNADKAGMARSWSLVSLILERPGIDPLISSVVLRTAANMVQQRGDVEGLIASFSAEPLPGSTKQLFSRLSRFVSLGVAQTAPTTSASIAWATLTRHALESAPNELVDGARIMLMTLRDNGPFDDHEFRNQYGAAARLFLQFAWTGTSTVLQTDGIRYVTRSFSSDPAASRALLERVLGERFPQHGSEEAHWLAEGVRHIADCDPAFAVEIYDALFSRPAPQTGQSYIGGQRSQLLPLISSKEQDYQHARWELAQALKQFIRGNPPWGVRAAIAAVAGSILNEHPGVETLQVQVEGRVIRILEDRSSLEDWKKKRARRGDPDDDALAILTQFLSDCSDTDFAVCIGAAIDRLTPTSIWVRIIGTAAERKETFSDLLWPVVTSPEFLSFHALVMDAVRYIGSVYPSQQFERRLAFERLVVTHKQGQKEQVKWSSVLARLLSVIPPDALTTTDIANTRRELHEAGDLVGNRPYLSMEFHGSTGENIVERLLESDGVDLSREPDKLLRVATDALERALREDGAKAGDRERIERLWALAQSVVTAINNTDCGVPHAQTLHASWGAVSNAVEIVAKSEGLTSASIPSTSDVVSMVAILKQSKYPEAQSSPDDSDDLMAWGNWDVRVYAASSALALVRKQAKPHPELLSYMRDFLADPVPAVRLQVAQSVNALWDIARAEMWELATYVAENETHPSVLGFFIGGPINRLAWAEPARCESIMELVLHRVRGRSEIEDDGKPRTFCEAVGYVAAVLWVGQGRPKAKGWINDWLARLPSCEDYLWHLISHLRDPLFIRFREGSKATDSAVQARARELLEQIVYAGCPVLTDARKGSANAPDERTRKTWVAFDKLLDHGCNQLYFGSGAFRNSEEEPRGLLNDAVKREFLAEYKGLLSAIAQAGSAHTLHHLIELYDFLVPGNPEFVFDQTASILVGPAARQGYQYESLALDALVGMLGRYLADHRAIFEEPTRRQALVEILELFSDAGWPPALKLLYELPDLLR